MADLPPADPVARFRTIQVTAWPYVPAFTSWRISAELFAVLEAHSEVRETGVEFLKQKTGRPEEDCEKLYLQFQAYIRQAKTFFTAAEDLHHRASPLFTYYAFLNLAKAYLCRRVPDLMLNEERLRHGLSAAKPRADFKDESFRVSAGVFEHLYHGVTDIRLSELELNIQEMFLYVSDISFDPAGSKPDKSRLTLGKSRYVLDEKGTFGRWLVAIATFEGATEFPGAFEQFFDKFEEVDTPQGVAERLFGIMSEARSLYRFFQTKVKFDPNSATSMSEFGGLLQPVICRYMVQFPFYGDFEFLIGTPVGGSFAYPWSEMFASYVLFFYLGSLVRYHPAYLERLLGRKEAWLIEQFATTARLTLLRHFVMYVLDKGIVLAAR